MLNILLLSFLYLNICLGLLACGNRDENNQQRAMQDRSNISPLLSDNDTDPKFKKALGPKKFSFPADHAAHPEFQTEWWYVTGNLETPEARKFGFQLTIFRRALDPEIPKLESKWATNQVYMAHFSISDVLNKKFYDFERFSRDSLGLAGANEKPFNVWLLDWAIQSKQGSYFPLTLSAKDKDEGKQIEINLQLQSNKPLVLQGDKGHSRKSTKTNNASYYYSYTRLKTEGTITIGDERFPVKGNAWLDREWSTSALDESQKGWDWFALQLSNNEEIMFYQLRQKNGEIDPASAGSYIHSDGKTTRLKHNDVSVKVLSSWESTSEIRYPSEWQFNIPDRKIALHIRPLMNNQEVNVSVRYWEGAVKITGSIGSENIKGYGYVELAGYTGN